MTQCESFSDSLCTEQIHLAELELSAFVAAVTELFGADQARMSVEDWLDELELMDLSSRSTQRDWRAITIAASVRLAIDQQEIDDKHNMEANVQASDGS